MDAQISISSSHTNAKVKRCPVGMKTVTIRSKKEEKKEWKKVNGSKKRRWKRQKNVNRSAV
jgi:hypothetical protein